MKTKTNVATDFKSKVDELIQNGQTIVIVRDKDNEAWQNGWADYLMNNYTYSNLNESFRVNLEKPIQPKTI